VRPGNAEAAESGAARRAPSKWVVLGLVFFPLLLADQWTKFLAVERLTYLFQRFGIRETARQWAAFYQLKHLEGLAREPYVVWKPVWRMSYAENTGSAFGLFRSLPDGFRVGFFLLVSLVAVAYILWYYRKLRRDQRWLQLSLAFVLTGALGNFADRASRGYVVDFIQWHWWNRPDLYWPTFNVADALIVVGVAMLVVHPAEKGARRGSGSGTASPPAP
jgi:signal peptidase II